MLAKKLKWLRIESGRKLQEISDAIGITGASISHYENGGRTPSADILKKLADFYGVSLDYLLDDSDVTAVRPPTRPEDAKRCDNAEKDAKSGDGTLKNKGKSTARGVSLDLPNGLDLDDISEEGKAELYKFLQYLRYAYPKRER